MPLSVREDLFAPVLCSFGHVPRSGIAGSSGEPVFDFGATSKLFSTVAALFYLPTNGAGGFRSPHVLITRHLKIERRSSHLSLLIVLENNTQASRCSPRGPEWPSCCPLRSPVLTVFDPRGPSLFLKLPRFIPAQALCSCCPSSPHGCRLLCTPKSSSLKSPPQRGSA